MTDAEIIKANDILKKIDFFGGQRAGRELWFEKPTDIQNEDVENFSKDVAFLKDFINRQKEQIEKLNKDAENFLKVAEYQQGLTMKKSFEIKDLKAEIERFHKLQKPTAAGGFKIENGKIIFYSDVLNGYRHEYKDLDEIVKELNLYMHTDYKNIELISHYQHKAQTAKAEAIKEFAFDLTEEVKQIDTTKPHEDKDDIIIHVYDIIDSLVKEMVGKEDA